METTTERFQGFVESRQTDRDDAIYFHAVGFGGEAGEVLNEIKKEKRDGIPWSHREAIRDELGDALNYLTALARDYGYELEDIMRANMEKLRKRDEAKAGVE